jgi:N-acetylmuramoyl-L-alanine amidase
VTPLMPALTPGPFVPDSPHVADVHPAANVEPRRDGRLPDLLLLHYTGMRSAAAAIAWLARADSKVSCHYVIDVDGRITQQVPEALRAWHAGLSCWAGETDINSCSIGIEIQNPGHEMGYHDFPAAQMTAVAALSRDICVRHRIGAARVLAHSDVAPLRKIDPGEKFDWAWLAAEGVGHWVPPSAVAEDAMCPELRSASVRAAQRLFVQYGYDIDVTGLMDEKSTAVIRAFQRHFRPQLISGLLDLSTLATLERLLQSLPNASHSRSGAVA